MFPANHDYTMNGEPAMVRLYLPIPYGRKPDVTNPRASFLGGASPDEPACGTCQAATKRLVQLHIPASTTSSSTARGVDRTLQVYGCNRASCVDSLFPSGKLLASGQGVLTCRMLQVVEESTATTPEPVVTSTRANDDEDNDWNVSDGDNHTDSSMKALEAQLAAMESTTPSHPTTTVGTPRKKKSVASNSNSGFPGMELVSQQEPHVHTSMDDDDDDVGMATSDGKIQKMLARYMAQEEDVEILQALQGSGGGGREKEERLSATDRAFFAYSDRLKKAPRQVLRYAYGGVPLWSIPVQTKKTDTRSSQLQELPDIPPCCGKPRVFEVQLVPPLLHVLKVDSNCLEDDIETAKQGNKYAWEQSTGMNWANVAIYTCQQGSCQPFVLVQKAVDEMEGRRPLPLSNREPVVIPQDAQFDDDDDDEMEDQGEDVEEDDDTEDEAC